MTVPTTDTAPTGTAPAGRTPGYVVLPSSNDVIDLSTLLGARARSADPIGDIQVSTVTGGTLDASDPLPEGTIVIVVTA